MPRATRLTTSPFEDAPAEIFQLILKTSSKYDIVRLSMVNKRLKACFEPQIYHTIDWNWKVDTIPPIVLLLRSVLARPELSTYIRNVKLTGETFHLPPFRMKLPPRIPCPAADIDPFIVAVEESRVPNCKLWVEKLGAPVNSDFDDVGPPGEPMRLATMDALLALLLSRLPNLESLQLGPNFTKETTIVGSMFKHALCLGNVFGFSNFEMLKEVHFNPRIDVERRWGKEGNDERPSNTLCPLTFFYAPSIERIKATIEEPKVFEWPSSHPPNPYTLKSLEITLLREGTLGNILSACPDLDTLTYNFYADKAGYFYFSLSPVLSNEKLAASLEFVRAKLKSLILTCYITDHDWDGHECEPEGLDGRMTMFSTFPKLENLEVPFVYLLGNDSEDKIALADVLPKTLKTLTLTDTNSGGWIDDWNGWDGPVLSVIEQWLRHWRDSTPSLEMLHIVETLGDDCEVPFDQQLKSLGADTGLMVEVTESLDERGFTWPRVFERCSEG